MSKYPEAYSDVEVTFMDGEVKTYRISAGPGIGGYLAREAGSSGVLSLFNGKTGESWAVPVQSIREWCVRLVHTEKVAEAPRLTAREAVLRFLVANSDNWWKPHMIVAHVQEVCPSIDADSSVYAALKSLSRDGLIEKYGKLWSATAKGMSHDQR